ncbi:MAG: DNA-processing protein DprA [Oscillospiraceae bacterium]|nr:DNA-processing protein DprA [Oscillospiraceae bacterium]
MNVREQGFLLLTSHLGDPERKILSVAQLRTLSARIRSLENPDGSEDVTEGTLTALGYSVEMARRILQLLSGTEQLQWYLNRGAMLDCFPLSRAGEQYPKRLRARLGIDCPGCLWTKGDRTLLNKPAVALIGSRDLKSENLAFARQVGRQAALQGYVLVSGNARGADRAAQDAAVEFGGQVISVVADRLDRCPLQKNVLYLSEDSYDAGFSAQRALSRNRVIHTLADAVLVAQCENGTGGTWDGTMKNLRYGWTPVFGFDDGTAGVGALTQMGALPVSMKDLSDLSLLTRQKASLF